MRTLLLLLALIPACTIASPETGQTSAGLQKATTLEPSAMSAGSSVHAMSPADHGPSFCETFAEAMACRYASERDGDVDVAVYEAQLSRCLNSAIVGPLETLTEANEAAEGFEPGECPGNAPWETAEVASLGATFYVLCRKAQ